jgi:hypothetical protein
VSFIYKLIKSRWGGFWRFLNYDKNLFVAVSSLSGSGSIDNYTRPTTGTGELNAYGYLRESLADSHIRDLIIHVTTSDTFPHDKWSCNIVSIGGTQFNSVTKYFMQDTDYPFTVINADKKFVHDNIDDIKYYSLIEDNTIKIDYGIITKIKNPRDKTKTVIIFRGMHTFGTAACAKMLTKKYIKELMSKEKTLKSKTWQAIIMAHVNANEVYPSLVSIKKI